MSDLYPLLNAVRANPDDRVARLVFADWLDEHDDTRGSLLRTSDEAIQMIEEYADVSRRLNDPRALELPPLEPGADAFEHLVRESETACGALEARHQEIWSAYPAVGELLAGHYDQWCREQLPELGAFGFNYETFGGFVDAVHAPVSLWRCVRPELVSPHPIRALYLTANFSRAARTTPDTNVTLPHLKTLAVSARWWRGAGIGHTLPAVPPSADLDFIRDCVWLSSAEELVLDIGSGGQGLLAWAARALPQSRHEQLPAVRLLDTGHHLLNVWYGQAVEFCTSDLVHRVRELDLGTLLTALPPAEIDALLRRPFGSVRALELAFLPPGFYLGAPTDIDPELRVILDRAAVRWGAEGRVLRWRAVPPGPGAPHPAERVLRAFWSAADIGWRIPDLNAHRRDYHDEESDYEPYQPPESDADWGITPTRRELYRGRFRNPKR